MPSSRRTSRAFTLLELILVMGIMIIVSALVAPSLRGLGTARQTQDEASLMVSVSQYARTQAISQGCIYRLNLDVDGGAFWLTAQTESGGAFNAPSGDFGQRYRLPDGMKMTTDLSPRSDGRYVQFLPGGRSDAVSVTFTHRDGSHVVVAAASATEPMRIVPQGVSP